MVSATCPYDTLLIVVYESFIFCISNLDDAAVARGEIALGLSLMHQLVMAEVADAAELVDAVLKAVVAEHPRAVGELIAGRAFGVEAGRLLMAGHERPRLLVVQVARLILAALQAIGTSPGIEEQVVESRHVLHNISVDGRVGIGEQRLRVTLQGAEVAASVGVVDGILGERSVFL